MIEICALASGSNGNCYYIGNQHDAILIDAGISARLTLTRMASRGLAPEKLKAIFITHEHFDHARGARVLSKKLGIAVYYTRPTWNAIPSSDRPLLSQFFEPGDAISSGSFTVHAILKNHDAAQPCSFRVEHNGRQVGVFTDIGEPCDKIKASLQQCHAVFLETNYDEKMLWEGAYPFPLKKRVASEVGHLSNMQALELVQQHAAPHLECIFLSHLSKENNTPEKALETFTPLQQRCRIKLTSRSEAGEVYLLK